MGRKFDEMVFFLSGCKKESIDYFFNQVAQISPSVDLLL